MNEIKTDFSACIAAGGDTLKRRVEAVAEHYSPQCADYFCSLCMRYGRGFEENACGFLLLDSLLQKHGINRAELIIRRGENGRPYIENRTDLDFSISYSEGGALCCIALGEGACVGADIQRMRIYSDEKLRQLASAFMSESDYCELQSISDSKERYDRFYTLWTRREAYIRRIGADVFADIRSVDLDTEDFSGGVISICGTRYYFSINAVAEKEKD
ncbi:MAG: 4'-phosphopantetheinyl transferase family protein [Oscillospiraceae bacterium]